MSRTIPPRRGTSGHSAGRPPGRLWPGALDRLGIPRHSPLVALVLLGTGDAVLGAVSWVLAAHLTHGGDDHPVLPLAAIAIGLHLLAGLLLGCYHHRDPVGSLSDLGRLGRAGLVTAPVLLVLALLMGDTHLLGTVLTAWLIGLALMGAMRLALRTVIDAETRPRDGERVLIIGAGRHGTALVDRMLGESAGSHLPVGFIDDDPSKRGFRYRGVRVLGTSEELAQVIGRSRAELAVVAIPQASPEQFSHLAEQALGTGLHLRTVPTVGEALEGGPENATFRELDMADLIGRPVCHPDPASARDLVAGRRILVTGAGGSIGSELCRQISRLDPASLIKLDRDESALHSLSLSLTGHGLLDTPDLVLADIRDPEALDAVFAEHRPEIVFHAAALKHLPLLESHPLEAWKSNVHGTQNVIATALAHGALQVVNISTDKAARPTSVLGRSKRLAEGLAAHAAERTGAGVVSVRFGNVIGSRGSVLPAFAEQIRAGGPVTVTHPDVTRYFMTIPEACELVLFAVSVGRPGETLVLDMGEPVRIEDVARRMMRLLGRSCPIVHTGLRPGEKLHEELLTPVEEELVSRSGRVTHVQGSAVDPELLPPADADAADVAEGYRRLLQEPVGGRTS